MNNPRLTVRSLLRARAFAIAAVLTFALGIGVNSAVFGAANAVLLHPLPGVDTRHLLSVETSFERGDLRHARVSPSNVWALADRRDVFAGFGGFRLAKVTLRDAGETAEIDAATTIGGFFEALGARPYLGRLYDARDAEHGDQRIIVLAYEFWRATLGADSSVIGRRLRLDDSTYQIVGVLAAGAGYPRGAALWTPRTLDPVNDLGRQGWAALLATTIARPRAGTTLADVGAALERQTREEAARHPELLAASDAKLVVRPLSDAMAGQLRPILVAIIVCAALVLLMACANVASLQLVRTSALAKEFAVRAALGATRWMLARQVGAESLVVAIAGGLLGVGAGQLVIVLIRRSGAAEFAGLGQARLDPPVVATLFGLILIAGALTAAASLRLTSRVDAGDVLRASRGASAGRKRDRFLRAAVVTQLALAIVLLLGATTAVRSLERLTRVDPGFDPENVTAVRMILPSPRYEIAHMDGGVWKPGNVTAFYSALVSRLRVSPGVEAVGLVTGAPFGYVQNNEHKMFVTLAGQTRKATDPLVDYWRVDPAYFRAMGIPLRAGRSFASTDDARGTDAPIIIDEVLARRLFAGRSPIGERFQFAGRIVGVVGSVKKADLAAADVGAVYASMTPWATNDLTVVVRSAEAPASVGRAVLAAAHDLDPTLAMGDVTPIVAGIDRSLAPQRFSTRIVLAFSSLSLALAIVGVCGVMLYGVSQRTRELGIRLALGATPEAVRRLVLGQGARLTAIGVAIGIVVYLAIASALSAIVFGLSPRDPLTIAGGVVALSSIALAAAYLPAYRAGRVDPVRSLSSE